MRSAEARFERVDHQQQLEQVALDRSAGRLHHEDVGAAHVLLNLDVDLAVGELLHVGGAERAAQTGADLLRQGPVGVPREDLESIVTSTGVAALRRP